MTDLDRIRFILLRSHLAVLILGYFFGVLFPPRVPRWLRFKILRHFRHRRVSR